MAFDYSELTGRIVTKFGSRKAFAEALGKKEQQISAKLNNRVGITRSEIIEWSKVLEIDATEYGRYFFTKEV